MGVGQEVVCVTAHVQGEPSLWSIYVKPSALTGTQILDVVSEARCAGAWGSHPKAGSWFIWQWWGLLWRFGTLDLAFWWKSFHNNTGRGWEGRLEKERPLRWGCCPDIPCDIEKHPVLKAWGRNLGNSRREKSGRWCQQPAGAVSDLHPPHVADAAEVI